MRELPPSTHEGSTSAEELGVPRPRVLVVDDEVFIACLISEMVAQDLREEPVQVHCAEDAIEELKRGEFSLVISDIRMPGIGGFGLLEWIEEKRPSLKDRFLFVTGCAGGPEADRTLARLGVPVLHKPFSCAELIELCRDLLLEGRSSEPEVQGHCCFAT